MSKNSSQIKSSITIFVIFLILLLFLPGPISGFGNINEIKQTERKKIYLTEKLDLSVDGSINPVRKNLTKDFDYITEIHFELDYEQTDWIPSDFAAGNPLDNGTVIFVDSEPFFSTNITKNDFFFLVCHEAEFIQDDKTPKITHIYGKFKFGSVEFCSFGLPYLDNSSLYFVGQDNLTDGSYDIEEFEVLIFGYAFDTTKKVTPDLVNPFDTMNIWFVWFLSMWPLWLVTGLVLAVFIYILREML